MEKETYTQEQIHSMSEKEFNQVIIGKLDRMIAILDSAIETISKSSTDEQ